MLFEPTDNMTKYMGNNVIHKLGECGKDVIIYPLAKITHPDMVSIGDNTRICDFCLLYPAGGTEDWKIL